MECITENNYTGWPQGHLQMGGCESDLRSYLTGSLQRKTSFNGQEVGGRPPDSKGLKEGVKNCQNRVLLLRSRELWVGNHQRMGMGVVSEVTVQVSTRKKRGAFKYLSCPSVKPAHGS